MMDLVHQAAFDKRGVIDTGIDCDDLSCLERYIGRFHDLSIHAGVTIHSRDAKSIFTFNHACLLACLLACSHFKIPSTILVLASLRARHMNDQATAPQDAFHKLDSRSICRRLAAAQRHRRILHSRILAIHVIPCRTAILHDAD